MAHLNNFAPLTIIALFLNFQYLWNLELWSDQAHIFRECFLHNYCCFYKRHVVLWDETSFVKNHTFFTPKC